MLHKPAGQWLKDNINLRYKKTFLVERYKNTNSGISGYEIGDDCIKIKFSGTLKIYTYSYYRAGRMHVEKMKKLAQKGSGLNTYINRHVKNLYD